MSDAKYQRPSRLIFWVSFIYILHSCTVHYQIFFSGQPFNELARDYLPTAYGFQLESLFALDAGYPPVFTRFVVLSISWLPLELQVIALSFLSMFLPLALSAPFITSRFRTVVIDDSTRALIVLAVLLFPDWETRLPINFSSLFLFPIFYVFAYLAINSEKKRHLYPFGLLALSKPVVAISALALVPFYFFTRNASSLWLSLSLFVGSAMFFLIPSLSPFSAPKVDLVNIWLAPLMWLEFMGSVLIAPLQKIVSFELQVILGCIVLTVLFLFWRRRKAGVLLFSAANIVIVSNFAILAVSRSSQWTIENLEHFAYFSYRQFMPAWQMAFFLFIPPIVQVFFQVRRKLGTHASTRWFVFPFIGIAPLLLIVPGSPIAQSAPDQFIYASWWADEVEEMETAIKHRQELPCIPINPLGTLSTPDCELVSGFTVSTAGAWKPVTSNYIGSAKIQDNPKVEFIALMIRSGVDSKNSCLRSLFFNRGDLIGVREKCKTSSPTLIGWKASELEGLIFDEVQTFGRNVSQVFASSQPDQIQHFIGIRKFKN